MKKFKINKKHHNLRSGNYHVIKTGKVYRPDENGQLAIDEKYLVKDGRNEEGNGKGI